MAQRIQNSLPKGVSRRTFLKVLGLTGGGVALASALNAARAGTAKPTLRFLNNEPDPNTIQYVKQTAQEYESKTGVKISVETIPVGETWTKITTAIKAGKPYDFLTLGVVDHALLLAKDGHVVPLTEFIKEVGVDDFGPRAIDWYRGEVWMYPYDYNFNYLFYRTDWFAQKHLQPPKSWDDMLNVLRALHDPDNKRYGIALPYSQKDFVNWGNTALLWAAGVHFWDKSWHVILDSPEIKPRAVKALQFQAEVYKYTPPGMINAELSDLLTGFTSGTAAMSSYTGRLIHHIEGRAPDLADKYDIIPYPTPDGTRGAVTHANDGFSVAKTANTEETMKFFRWFIKERLIGYQLTVPLHYQPPQFSTYKHETWRAHPLVKKHWRAMEVMLEFMNTAKTIISSIQLEAPEPSPNPGRVWEGLVIPRMYQNVVVKKLDPGEAVDIAAKELRELTVKEG